MLVRRSLHLVVLLTALAAAACGGGDSSPSPSSPPSSSTPTAPTPTTPLPAMSVMLSEKVLGNANAPVTMIEYSSLTCSHCGDFHVITLPQIMRNYVETGRVKFVYRDFPLNEAAIAGAMVARCSGDKYFATLDALFAAQNSWAYSTDFKPGLKAVVAPLGITANDVEACLASTELRNGILSIRAGGTQSYGINGTPTFVINGQVVPGAQPYAVFAGIIDSK